MSTNDEPLGASVVPGSPGAPIPGGGDGALTPEVPGDGTGSRRRRRVRRVWWGLGGFCVLLAAAVISSAFVKIPYWRVGPGNTYRTQALIQVDGADSFLADAGDLNYTTVSFRQATALEAVVDYFDPAVELLDEDTALGGQDPDENREQNLRAMTDAKEVATAVALQELGYDVSVTGTGALVVEVGRDYPAADVLEAGDTIVAVDGAPIMFSDELVAAIRSHAPGDQITLTIEPHDGGETRTETVTLAANPDDASAAMLGVSALTRDQRFEFPLQVSVESGQVGGPSAGLAFTLGLIDVLTPGNLTGSLKVATTGTISIDGTVGLVGGVPQKTVAAREDGVDLFIVPADEYEQTLEFAGDMRVVPVETLDDALRVLAENGGDAGQVTERALAEGTGD